MINRIFKNQLGRLIEGYVDGMLIKSMTFEHLLDLEEFFFVLSQYQIKLNPFECVFTNKGGKFMGFLVSSKEIESNPEKIQAILKMMPSQTVKEVQHLIGRLATLNRFIAHLSEHTLPLFKTLKNMINFK